jgi:hypothetical protein
VTSIRNRRAQAAARWIAGLFLILLGLAIGWRYAQGRGEDFNHPYVVGKMILAGRNVYDAEERRRAYREWTDKEAQWGMFYTPSSGVAMLPLALLPHSVARPLWFALLAFALLYGVWRLSVVYAPEWPPSARVLLLGLLMCSAGVRWNFLLLQPGSLVVGLLCLFVAALAQNKRGAALACASFVACLKVTFALPFLGLALVQRRWTLAAGVIALWALVNGIGFARMGGMEAVQGYRSDMRQFEKPGEPNYPDPRLPNSHDRLDWPLLLNAISLDPPRSRAISLALTVLAALWLCWEARRARAFSRDPQTAVVFLAPLTCLSLLCIYHQRYDAVILLAPLAAWVCAPKELRRLPGARWFIALVVLFAGLYSVTPVQAWAARVFGENADLYRKPLGCVVITLAFLASLAALHRFLIRSTQHPMPNTLIGS